MTPTEAIYEFRKREGLKRNGNASCPDAALFLNSHFPGSQIYAIEVWAVEPASISHYVIKINGRYYDGDTPKGMKNIRDLIKSRYGLISLFTRAIKVTPMEVRRQRPEVRY